MKQFSLDLWNKFKGRLVLLTGLMTLIGAIEGLGLILFLPLITLLSGESLTKNSGFSSQYLLTFMGAESPLWYLTFSIITIFFCQAILSLLQGKLIATLESEYVDIWRRDLLTAILKAKWSFFVNHKNGQLLFAFGTETERVGRAFLLVAQIASAIILLLIYFMIAVYLSWIFSLVLISFGLLGFLLFTRNFARKSYETGDSYAKHNSRLLGYVSESLSAAKMIKSTGSEERVIAQCKKILSILKQDYFGAVFYPYALRSILEFFITISICVSLLLMHHIGVNFAPMIILMAVFLRILPKLNVVQSSYQMLIGYLPSFDVLSKELNVAKCAVEENNLDLDQPHFTSPVKIKFENVTMQYQHTPILTNINFSIKAGTIAAIIGHSGAGKSTLLDLIVNIVQPSEGMISINDISLKQLNIFNWRQAIGYVTQEPFLLHDTVWNNITWGAPNCTEDDVMNASKLANAHQFIQHLPQGYHTIVGERGSKLSGGERQRIALARALVSKPVLLILDESTSALDVASEQAIMESLQQLRGKLTILLISHRLIPVTIADQIILLDQGSIIEVGTWDQLIKSEGRFTRLWETQQLPLMAN